MIDLRVIIAVVVIGVIGFAITDSITTSAQTLADTTNETETWSNTAGPSQTFTAAHIPIKQPPNPSMTNTTGSCTLVYGTNFTVASATAGTVTLSSYNNASCGTALKWSYTYEPDSYLHSDLSRTIVAYIVPLGLIGILAASALMIV